MSFAGVTTKSVAPLTGLFRPIQHTASLTCSGPLRLPNSDDWKTRGRLQHGCSNYIPRFDTAANLPASSVLRNFRRLSAMRCRVARVKVALLPPLSTVNVQRRHALRVMCALGSNSPFGDVG